MGIVCEKAENASSMQRYADMIHTTLIAGMEAPEPPKQIKDINGVLGVLTLEDIIEKLLQVDIIDETERDLALARSKSSETPKPAQVV